MASTLISTLAGSVLLPLLGFAQDIAKDVEAGENIKESAKKAFSKQLFKIGERIEDLPIVGPDLKKKADLAAEYFRDTPVVVRNKESINNLTGNIRKNDVGNGKFTKDLFRSLSDKRGRTSKNIAGMTPYVTSGDNAGEAIEFNKYKRRPKNLRLKELEEPIINVEDIKKQESKIFQNRKKAPGLVYGRTINPRKKEKVSKNAIEKVFNIVKEINRTKHDKSLTPKEKARKISKLLRRLDELRNEEDFTDELLNIINKMFLKSPRIASIIKNLELIMKMN